MSRLGQASVFSGLLQLWRTSSASAGETHLPILLQRSGCVTISRAASLRDALSKLRRLFSSSTTSSQQQDGAAPRDFVTLNTISDNPGASKKGRRLGRGIGSSKGKTSGRGHKGQRARSGGGPKPGFEGGQTPLRLRVPKRGFHNPFTRCYQPLNLDTLKDWVTAGRLDPAAQVLTMRELRDSGAVRRKLGSGVKLLGRGAAEFDVPGVHLQVSQASATAREAVERAGGSVTTVYYNELGLRALVRPEWFAAKGRLLPRSARPPPKLAGRFDRVGELPPRTELPAASQEAGA